MTDDPKQNEETIDIENAGNSVSVRMHGATVLSFDISGDAVATYQIDGRIRGGTWQQDIDNEYSGSSDYNDTRTLAWYEVRVRCSTGTASAGDSATITLSAGGG